MMARLALWLCVGGALAADVAGPAPADAGAATLTPRWAAGASGALPDSVFTDAERAWLAERHPVVVALGPYPPYVFISPRGEASGISIDYLGEISARTGVEFVLVRREIDYVRSLESMARSEGPDLMPITRRESGRPLEFSKRYLSTDVVIFTQVNAPFVGGVDDLRGRRVATSAGIALDLEEKVPDHGMELIAIEHEMVALRALARGQVDAFIGDLLIGSYEIQRMGLANVGVAAPSPFESRTFSIGVRPDWPELRSVIDKALASMTPGEHAAIRTRHMGVRYEHGIKPGDVLRWVGVITSVAIVLVLLTMAWNRQLARRVRARTSELTAAGERLRALASELTIAEERERRRLAGELHDQVGQPLALARIQLAAKLGGAGRITGPSDVEDVSETLLLASQETRRLIADLSTPSMGPLGLAAAVSDWMDDRLARSAGLTMSVVDECEPGGLETLPENTRAILFRNVRELLTNVIKHANASRVVVRLSGDAENVRVRVEDDGVGFDAADLKANASDAGGFGLFSVTERMVDLGGAARILSRPGEGCAIELTLPLIRGAHPRAHRAPAHAPQTS